jgi:ribosomal protein S18 acetylase RimI-like enzyme
MRAAGVGAAGVAVETVRPANLPEELRTVRAMLREYEAELGVDLGFQGFEQELASLPGDYAPPRGALLVAEVEGAMAGCVALRPLDADACEMKRLYARPAFRGRGVGRALAAAVIAEARRIGYAHIWLDTLPVMTEAQALYQRLGFTDISSYRENPVPGARYLGLTLTERTP